MATDSIIVELLGRIHDLESRVTAIENGRYEKFPSTTPDVPFEEPPVAAPSSKTRGNTRELALKTLRQSLKDAGVTGVISGQGNRGKNQLFFQDAEGEKKRIYLSTSRNYSSHNPSADFSSWHTITPDDITEDRYEIFVLSAEDEAGDPQLFVFSVDEMRNFVTRKTPDNRPYYHFYLTRKGEDGFEDWRQDPSYPSQEVTDFYENWEPFIA